MGKGGIATISMKAPKNLVQILAKGANIMKEAADRKAELCMIEFARVSAVEAIEYYDESGEPFETKNLTGNTRTSFCAAVYKDGICKQVEVGYKLAGMPAPYHYTFIGDRGFTDRGNGEFIKSGVKDYSDDDKYFVDIDNVRQTAYNETRQFLQSYSPKNKVGWTVVVASMSPYVELINEWKDIDILETSKEYHKETLRSALASVAKK